MDVIRVCFELDLNKVNFTDIFSLTGYGGDTAADITSQQTNVALISALLLTVQFAFAYALPSIWGPMNDPSAPTYSYLISLMTEDQAKVVYEARTCLQ